MLRVVNITAIDECGNSNNIYAPLLVLDCKKPTPYCKNGLVVEVGQTGNGEVTKQAGNAVGITASAGGKSAANLAEERIKQLIPMQQQSQNEAGGSVYSAATPQPVSIYANASTSASGGQYTGGGTAQPQTQAADGMQQTTSPFRAFYPDACDVQRLNYNDCNTVTMYPRETTTHFASPVPRETTTHFASPVPTSSQTQ